MMLTSLNAIDTLPISETGYTKSISSSCVNSSCTITINTGSQLFFTIENNTNKNLVLTKFEILKTYNGTSVVTTSTTDKELLGGTTFDSGETVALGYTLIYGQIANYWTAKYYITDTDTGEKYSNSLKWDNDINTFSVTTEDLTENMI